MDKNRISVIIPVRRKEPLIPNVLRQIPDFCEIIIVTASKEFIPRIITKNKHLQIVKYASENRSELMNKGAELSKGNIFFFLHPDTLVDTDVFLGLQKIPESIIGGGVSIKFDKNHPILKMISWGSNNIRMKIFKIIYGDQCIFVRKKIFEKLNGYTPMMIFEDFEFSSRLRKEGKIKFLASAQTSARRFMKKGIIKQMFLNFYLVFLYKINFSDRTLRKYYDK